MHGDAEMLDDIDLALRGSLFVLGLLVVLGLRAR